MAPSDNTTTFSDESNMTRDGSSLGSSSQQNPGWAAKEQSPVWADVMESVSPGCGADTASVEHELNPPWMDWIESGIEFFGCEGDTGRNVIGRALMLQHSSRTKDDRDYVRLHEDFFEALLKEQLNFSAGQDAAPPGLTPIESTDDSINSEVSSSSSTTLESSSLSSTKTIKRRRPLKLHKLSPRRKSHARVAPIEAYNRKYNPALQEKTISLEAIVKKKIPEPSSFMHPRCVLQKDKGKGDALGASISAEGRDMCLEKLREKMALVVQVSGEERKASTGMKRRVAKITCTAPNYIETRSMIELRLGFLSMQYGLLLQWDHNRTGKVIFMVLRKMCHDSFYSKSPSLEQDKAIKTTIITRKQITEPPPLVVRNVIGNHAIYQRLFGTEVVLVDPPYRVAQPEVFAPSALTVEVNNIVGLSKRSRWTLSITFNGHTELAHLHFDHDKNLYETKRPIMKWEVTPITSFDLAGLEIRLFEQSKRKNSQSRLASTMTMPLGGLVAQPSTSHATSWRLTMPFTHDPNAKLTLSFVHQSDYAHWLYKELDARRSEEVSGFVWKAPFRKVNRKNSVSSSDAPPSGEQDIWDWLCGVCFKEYYLPIELPCHL